MPESLGVGQGSTVRSSASVKVPIESVFSIGAAKTRQRPGKRKCNESGGAQTNAMEHCRVSVRRRPPCSGVEAAFASSRAGGGDSAASRFRGKTITRAPCPSSRIPGVLSTFEIGRLTQFAITTAARHARLVASLRRRR